MTSDEELENMDRMDRLFEREMEISVVQDDPTPVDPKTYLPEYAWPEYWWPGQKFKVVDTLFSEQEYLLEHEFVCDFALARISGCFEQAQIFFKDKRGLRVDLLWSNLLPINGVVDGGFLPYTSYKPGGRFGYGLLGNWCHVKRVKYIGQGSPEWHDDQRRFNPLPNEELAVLGYRLGGFVIAGPEIKVAAISDGREYSIYWHDLEVLE